MQQEKRSALQLKHSQKERQRAEIMPSIRSVLNQWFDEQYNRFLDSDGGNSIAFHTSV